MDGLDDKGGDGIAAGWFNICLSATVGDCRGDFTPKPGAAAVAGVVAGAVAAAAAAIGSFPINGGNSGVVAKCVDSSSSFCSSN